MNLEEARQEKSFTLAMRVFSPHGEQPPAGAVSAAGSGPGLWVLPHLAKSACLVQEAQLLPIHCPTCRRHGVL